MNNYLEHLNYGFMALPAALLIVTASLGLGLAVMRYVFRTQPVNHLAHGLVSFVLGLDLIALIVLGMGSLGLLNPVTVWGILLVPSVAVVLGGGVLRALRDFARDNVPFTVLLTLGFLLILGSALCYPYSWDENSYQVAVPYRWINTGTLAVFMDNPYSAFPSLPQFITRLGLEAGGILMSRIICCILYGVFFLSLYCILTNFSSKLNALIIVAALFLSPVFMIMMRETYAEPHMLVNLTAIFLLPAAIQLPRLTKLWVLSGIFCGAAMAVKLTGAGLVPPVLIMLYAMNPELRREPRKLLLLACGFGLAAFLFMLPFYLRTFVYTGNPFYPFFTSLFGMSQADQLVDQFHHAMGDRYFGLKTFSSFFTGPVLASVYDLYALDQNALFDGIPLGWSFLLLTVAGAAGCYINYRRGWQDRMLPALLCMLAVFYVFWYFTSQQTRFFLPGYLFAALLAGRLLPKLPPKIANFLLGVLLFATLYNTHWVNVRHFKTSWQIACAPRNTEFFLTRTFNDPGYIEALAFLEEQTPPDASVMLILERRGLYVPRRYEIAAPYFQSKYLTPVPATAAGVYETIRRSGAGYVLVGATSANLDHIDDFDEETKQLSNLISELEKQQLLHLEFQMGYFWVFKVKTTADKP